MTLFALFQTDQYCGKFSNVCCGIFDSRNKAKDAAKYYNLEHPGTKVLIREITLNLFEEI